jgi:hypothetical protein
MKFAATINIPGYLPLADETPVFDTAQDAWGYLAEERELAEDYAPVDPDTGHETGEYSGTWGHLKYIASGEHQHGNPNEDWPTNADGTGTVYGGNMTGPDDEHDLGLAYTVRAATDEEIADAEED